MASLTLRGTVTGQTSLSADTATVTKPTGIVANDIMFCMVGTDTAYTNSTPSGWTSLGKANPSYFFELFYKVAGASEPADYTWTTATTQRFMIRLIGYERYQFNHVTPLDQTSNTPYVTNNTTNRAASMTVTSANSPLIYFSFVGHGSAITSTKPTAPNTDWVEDLDDGDTNPDMWFEICSMFWASNGATGDIDNTLSTAETNKHAMAVSLNPATGVTVSPSAISATFSVQAPVVSAGASMTVSAALSATFSVQSPTVTLSAAEILNLDKSSTSTFTNPDKS